MKRIYVFIAAALGFFVLNAYSQKYSSVSEYRKEYSTLVQKWTNETNEVVRLELRQQIEQLKKDNTSLFANK